MHHWPTWPCLMQPCISLRDARTHLKTRPSRPTMRPLWMNVFYEWMFFMNECFYEWMFFMNECCLWMSEWFNQWIIHDVSLLCGKDVRFCDFDECVTRPTDRQTDRQTDTASYRDARTHLKMVILIKQFKSRWSPLQEQSQFQFWSQVIGWTNRLSV